MSRNSLFNWLLTERGKEISFLCAGAVTTAVNLSYFLPNTLFLELYKDIVRLYSKGYSVPVPENLLKRFLDTLNLLEIPRIDRPDCKPFMTCGFDIFSAGTSYSKFGIAIGLPHHFIYENADSIDKSKIKVNQESVVWDTDTGKQLLQSLVLSEKAQKYAIAREIKYRQTPKIYTDIFFATSMCLYTYGSSKFFNTKFNLYTKPRSIRVLMYGLSGLLSLGIFFTLKDITMIYYEDKIDKELKELNPIFAEGGKEFYTKILQRNIALRQLMGKEGQSVYTVTGNENSLFRTKHLPLVHRKQFFERSDEKNTDVL